MLKLMASERLENPCLRTLQRANQLIYDIQIVEAV